MSSDSGCRGQSVLELTFSLAAVAIALSGAGALLKAEWDRTRCAYRVFEATHARLVGSLGGPGVRERLLLGLSLEESPTSIRGTGTCGKARETVEIRKLDSR